MPRHIAQVIGFENGYCGYLAAMHGVMHETCGFIDWDLLQSHGLPRIEEHKSVVSALESDLCKLREKPSYGFMPERPSVLPTFGVSIGMLFALAEGARAARRTAKMAARIFPEIHVSPQALLEIALADQTALRNSVVEWVNGLELSQGDREEALLAPKACVRFARRHFSMRSR